MRKFLKKKTVWLTAVAVALAGSMTIHSAIAYFTTYATASGSHPISIGSKTEIVEEFDNWTKHIQIQNTGENECFVRVKVFCGSQFTVQFSGEAGAWEERDDDGYWYYNDVLPAGGMTKELLAEITIPEDLKDSFNVVVIQECTQVLYKDDGTPYADWSKIIDTTTDIGGEGE